MKALPTGWKPQVLSADFCSGEKKKFPGPVRQLMEKPRNLPGKNKGKIYSEEIRMKMKKKISENFPGNRCVGGDQCSVGDDQCSVGDDQCSVGGDQCSVGGDQCSVGGDQGSVGGDQCRVGGDQCSVGGDQCSVGDDQCRVGGDQRGVGDDQGSVGDDQCGVGDDQCSVGDDHSSVGGDQGSVGDDQCGVGDDHSSVGDGQCSVGDDHSSVGGDQGTVGDDQGSVGDDQGSVVDDHSSVGGDQSSVGDDQCGVGDDQGSVGNDKSIPRVAKVSRPRSLSPPRPSFALQTCPGPANILESVSRALQAMGWVLSLDWILLWTWGQPIVKLNELSPYQRVNHFMGNHYLTKKDHLRRSHDRHVMKGGIEIYPETFMLPRESMKFMQAFEDKQSLWIMKPVGLSRGRGVKVVSEIGQVLYCRPVVVQRYISNPVLLNGYKFDLRLYVLVICYSPLTAFLYKEGFARLASVKYSIGQEELDKYAHITNVAIQKEYSDNVTKITLSKLATSSAFAPGQFKNTVWPKIKEVALKTLEMGEGNIKAHRNCFELFGLDMIIEEGSLRVWLLEVNASPSLAVETDMDERVKIPLIQDVVKLVTCKNLEINTFEKL